MSDAMTPEMEAALRATEKMGAAYTKDIFTAEQRGYARGKAEAEKRIWEAAKRFNYSVTLSQLREIIFGGGDVE